jgi:hypothetical protein
MIYFLRTYDIYLLGLLLALLALSIKFLFPTLFFYDIAALGVGCYVAFWLYLKVYGCRWYALAEEFRSDLIVALVNHHTFDFEPCYDLYFLMPRIYETRMPSKSISKTSYVNTRPSKPPFYVKSKMVTHEKNRLYLNIVLKHPKASTVYHRALGVLSNIGFKNRPMVNIDNGKLSSTPKTTIRLYLGKFDKQASSATIMYTLKLLNAEFADSDTSIYPI